MTGGTTTDKLQVTSLGTGIVVSDSNGNITSTTSLTGAYSLTGLNVNGNTTTSSLTVNGTATLNGNTYLSTTGGTQAYFGTAGQTTIDSGGNVSLNNGAALSVNGSLVTTTIDGTNGIVSQINGIPSTLASTTISVPASIRPTSTGLKPIS